MTIKNFMNIPKSNFMDFEFLCNFIMEHDTLEIARLSMINKGKFNNEIKDVEIQHYANNTFEGIFKTPFVGGATLWDCIVDLKQNLDEYIWLYNILEDQQSKDTLLRIMVYRIFMESDNLNECSVEGQYYIPDILPKRENSVFVDCGAFDGDTTKQFIEIYGEDYKRIYAYEPIPKNYEVVCESLKDYENVIAFNKGVSSEKAEMRFTSNLPATANRIHPSGNIVVPISTLDEDIKEPITFLKMDIEGAEQSALLGSKTHIIQDKPQLAICVYHTIQDIWKIPQIIYSFNKYQKFYLRYHGFDNQWEIVFYADPYTGDSLQQIKNLVDKKSINETLVKIDQLTQTIQEGISYVSIKLDQDDFFSSKEMIDLIKEALLTSISKIDDIRNNL